MTLSEYHGSYEGIGEMLRSEMILGDLVRRAERVRARAAELSPVGDPRRDRHAGRYKAAWRVESTTHGGSRGNRAQSKVVNDTPEAVPIEFGNLNITGRHVLGTAINAARD